MRRYIYKFFIGVFVLYGFSLVNLNAQSERFIIMQEEVSIRYKTEKSDQGLKFTANVHKDATEGVAGMYIAYGEVSSLEFITTINNNEENNLIINGKKVFHVQFSTLSEKNTLSVIVTGIPVTNYTDLVSVIGYVEVSGINVFSEHVIVKSIAEVAFGAINEGHSFNALNEIVEEMEQKIVFAFNALGDLELNNSFYEYDHLKLKEKFSDDFKELTEVEFLDLDTNDKDIFNFFGNQKYKAKWGFLLDYFLYLSDNEALNGQIDNLKEGKPVESLDELIYALTNFFNEQNYRKNIEIIDFTNKEKYLELKNYNNKVLINPSQYELYKVGDEIEIPLVLPSEDDEVGHAFDYFTVSNKRYNPKDLYVVTNENVVFKKEYALKEYNLIFNKENGEFLGERQVKHNDTLLNTPDYIKEGYVIVHWLDENNNLVNSETPILKDMILKPVFKIAITEINFTVDKGKYIVVSASNNIDFELDPKDKKYNYLYITPQEDYGFVKDVKITVTFTDGTVAKFINQTILSEYIEYIYDDPGWTGRY